VYLKPCWKAQIFAPSVAAIHASSVQFEMEILDHDRNRNEDVGMNATQETAGDANSLTNAQSDAERVYVLVQYRWLGLVRLN
jgi:hypothetical protein